MNPGILYYNMGKKNLGRLAVSLYTLRMVYDGEVAVLVRDEPPRWFRIFLGKMKTKMIRHNMGEISCMQGKANLWRYSPFDPTLHIDADTVILKDPSKAYFDALQNGKTFAPTNFCGWRSDNRRISGRIKLWAKVLTHRQVRRAIAYGPAINGGVVAWLKDSKFLPRWSELTQQGWDAKCLNRMVDELASQCLLPQFADEVQVMDSMWNWSPKFGKDTDDLPGIVHYHGFKHVHPYPMCVYFKCLWHKLQDEYGIKSENDRRLNRYLNAYPDGLTLCTVVNQKYSGTFDKHFDDLQSIRTEINMQQRCMNNLSAVPFIVFRVGKNAWNPPANSGITIVDVPENPGLLSDREYCLQQFVYGPAKHVQTSHWMKLDADVTLKDRDFTLPDYRGHAITAHRWGYTRCKGDRNAKKHWLNTLDDWYWGGPKNYPANIPVGDRYGHNRVNSFCAIYQTSFTQQVALKCPGRLPVPSEDTTTFYLAEQWHLPILRYNAKKWLTQ